MQEQTKIEKIYGKLKQLQEEAKEDIRVDKAQLESQFDSAGKVVKWLNKKSDWQQVSNSLESKKKEAWRKAYEYYRTEYNLKLNSKEEYTMMIESDPSYSTLLLECQAVKEVIEYIHAVIEALKSRHLGGVAIDVYEEEGDLFFRDLSEKVIQDDVFARLSSFPNVLISGHQAFFTQEALDAIAETTVANLLDLEAERELGNRVVKL